MRVVEAGETLEAALRMTVVAMRGTANLAPEVGVLPTQPPDSLQFRFGPHHMRGRTEMVEVSRKAEISTSF